MNFDHASDVYAKALKHVGELPLEGTMSSQQPPHHPDICAHLLLGYSRCCRKLEALEECKLSSGATKLKNCASIYCLLCNNCVPGQSTVRDFVAPNKLIIKS